MQNKTNSLITLSLVMLLCNFCFSQEEQKQSKVSIGFHGAPAGATFIGNYLQGNRSSYKQTPRLGYIGGINFQCQIKPKITLCFETNFESKGGVIVFKNAYALSSNPSADQIESLGTKKTEYINYLITTPITVKFKLNKKKNYCFANLGIYSETLIKSGWRNYPQGTVHYDKFNLNTPRFGLITGLGWNFSIKKHCLFSLELRNNLGIGNYFKYGERESFALLFGLGYKI